jgi:hypothetical protein
MHRFASFAAAAALLATLPALAQAPTPIADKYKPVANKILAAAASDTEGYADLTYLCDHIGKRLSGTPQLNTAVTWGAQLMRNAGFQNVTIQPVMVPRWVRGQEEASLISPISKPLHMLGLGMSVGTPPQGITADVVFAPDFATFDAMPDSAIKGKIVVFNPGWHGYGVNSMYRTGSPSRAAARGAAAVLVLNYKADQPKIPAAAITVEDALLIERLAKQGPVKIHLQMDAHMEPDVQAGNVIGDLPGSEHPEQIVVLGGHIDSWDVGQGAQDDGSGIMATFEAVSLIHKLGLQPKRTLRVVFWVNEENGGAGGRAYRQLVGDNIANHVAAIEMDGGAEKPLGIGYGSFGPPRRPIPPPVGAAAPAAPGDLLGRPAIDETSLSPAEKQSFATLRDIATLLAPIGADSVAGGGGGSDIGPIVADGVPALSPRTVAQHYFDWHHTEADTLDKVDPVEFRHNLAMLSVVAYILADMDTTLAGQKGQAHE